MRHRHSLEDYHSGILLGDKVLLAQAITLAESELESDRDLIENLIEKLVTDKKNSIRIGITGSPGVGKSTFIETFGKHLTAQNKKVAVLAIDPSSYKTKGSILGDKTRMEELAKDPLAFIRPSATRNTLGGVTAGTRESILLCEAAGFDFIIIETVGVGQSEVAVRNLVDFFLLLMLAGSGDELQGIKKGIMEMADGIVITKADGENLKKATQAQADFTHALHLFQLPDSGWNPKVLTTSALAKKGIEETINMISEYVQFTRANGFFDKNRHQQDVACFHDYFNASLLHLLAQRISIEKSKKNLENEIMAGQITPWKASRQLSNLILDALKKI
ncbi:MAG: methylmalonyl Co-A mutase-associated GTPase MeaB [Cytophagales bacterium]|nr:methylmalonyl Co-A mutase-associated GTPase MeaB [Cytophagales bacterium]MCA6387009.1 methylmalonyl Co-A mutase-associated GTPase MeaB [Cytophagales bacterium]MCA6390099.1 methylmalonyl Co-A mutase-associated GTPase MeaB [Cytophagales bacterium]MCA6399424.1 methylmalonyl Co-A mutase-associated GTPase MeaB [Cytophagales bacterium]MCA6403119.1 methylmalonyl Co-A mutase-associated GTPase MeaB [Cytophagales bacterium]